MKVGEITTVEFLGNEKFAIGKVLAGGMGTIYQLVPVRSGEVPALGLKTLQGVMTAGSFERECRAWLSVVEHDNIARAHAFGHWMGRPAVAMDWYPKAMSELSAAECTDPQVVQLIGGIVSALDYAYRHAGLIHQDIKPANILIDKWSHARLADFGLARCHTPRWTPTSAGHRFTIDESAAPVGGTRYYMAPELFQGALPSVASDLFALGVTIYQFFTGRHPYFGRNSIRCRTLGPQEEPLRTATAGRGQGIARIVEATLRSLSFDPSKRPCGYEDTGLLPTIRIPPTHDSLALRRTSAAVARATLSRETGDLAGAEADLLRSLDEAPHDPILLNASAIVKLKQGDLVEAYRLWSLAATVLGDYEGSWCGALYLDPIVNLAAQHLRKQEHQAALELLTRAEQWIASARRMARVHSSQETWYPELGWLHLRRGRYSEATDYLRECLATKGATPMGILWMFEAAWLSDALSRNAPFLAQRLTMPLELGAALCACVVAQCVSAEVRRQFHTSLGDSLRRQICQVEAQASFLPGELLEPRGLAAQRRIVMWLDDTITGGANRGAIGQVTEPRVA